MIPKLKMHGSKHSVLGIIQVTIDKIIVSITGFTTIDHRGTIALDEKLLNPTISQVTGSRINIKGKKGILDPVNNCQSIFANQLQAQVRRCVNQNCGSVEIIIS